MTDYEILNDGRTVWVNDDNGMCIGRFSKSGVDVHRCYSDQMAGMPQCLDCCHDLPFPESWDRFKTSMYKHHNVIVDDAHRPTTARFDRPIAR